MSILSSGTSKSQRASMHSRPLFSNVAVSTVIFCPICQFGCRSASSAVTIDNSLSGVSRKGPPEAVIVMRSIESGRSPQRHCQIAECSESMGRSSALDRRASAVMMEPVEPSTARRMTFTAEMGKENEALGRAIPAPFRISHPLSQHHPYHKVVYQRGREEDAVQAVEEAAVPGD